MVLLCRCHHIDRQCNLLAFILFKFKVYQFRRLIQPDTDVILVVFTSGLFAMATIVMLVGRCFFSSTITISSGFFDPKETFWALWIFQCSNVIRWQFLLYSSAPSQSDLCELFHQTQAMCHAGR